jgi:nicotinate-nucleotide--dimethylbenzimidazole phosphoribosyltransferase
VRRPGRGLGDEALGRKRAVVSRAVDAARARLGADPVGAMASVGGLEIAAIAGFFAEAAEIGLTVVLDGFVATSGALVAERLRAGTGDAPDRGPSVGRAGDTPWPWPGSA